LFRERGVKEEVKEGRKKSTAAEYPGSKKGTFREKKGGEK